MIQHRPVCFHCEQGIDSGAIFAPPMCDHEACPSAAFHGLCLMEWREHREELRTRAKEAYQAFMRHVNGECECEGRQAS